MQVPGPPPREMENLRLLVKREPLATLTALVRRYGNVCRVPFATGESCFLNDPEHIRQVLVSGRANFRKGRWNTILAEEILGQGLLTSEAENHSWQRRMLQPAFNHESILQYAKTMSENTVAVIKRWNVGRDEKRLNIHSEMIQLTRDIVVKALFGVELGPEFDAIYPYGPGQVKEDRRKWNSLVDEIIARRRSGGGQGDVLSYLLDSQNQEGRDPRLTNELIRDEVATLFLAGHMTVSNALTWTWFLISQNPSVEGAFHQEIDSVLTGEIPVAADYVNLSYTRKIFEEALRLYPPVWNLEREVVANCTIGAFSIPSGSRVLISPYVTQRDERFFSEPDKFRPERWDAGPNLAQQRQAYFPFGLGFRTCIGEHFARLEGAIVLACIGRELRIRLAPDYKVVPVAPQLGLLHPKDGIEMLVSARKN